MSYSMTAYFIVSEFDSTAFLQIKQSSELTDFIRRSLKQITIKLGYNKQFGTNHFFSL